MWPNQKQKYRAVLPKPKLKLNPNQKKNSNGVELKTKGYGCTSKTKVDSLHYSIKKILLKLAPQKPRTQKGLKKAELKLK